MENKPISDAELAEVKRKVAEAPSDAWIVGRNKASGRVGVHNGKHQVCAVWHTTANPAMDTAQAIAALHTAFPAILARLEAAERERDTAKAEVARQWMTLTEIAELVEDYADCDDSEEGIANRPNLAMQVQMMADKATQCNPQAYAWLAARDAKQRREGAAKWLENAAREGGYYERSSDGMLQEAKQLREGK